ncbi:unnamed protein product [Mytilus coruscus]|uniref:Uncharacterized protein n=1 Tax=Mytilus coruscus TaxID=42192 RepID=A0A6J8ERF0_MYTCO|nr:unnamed protein product [Mytilus coruscus]
MSHYQSVQASVHDYLTSLPEGLQHTYHTRTAPTGQFLILHFGNGPASQATKEEPMDFTTNIRQEPGSHTTVSNQVTVKEEPMDIKPILQNIKQETNIKEEIGLTTLTTDTQTGDSVFSRLGQRQTEQLQDNYSSRTSRPCNSKYRRHNKKRSTGHSSNSVQDLRTFLNKKKQTEPKDLRIKLNQKVPKDLRQLIPKRLPLLMESVHEEFLSFYHR